MKYKLPISSTEMQNSVEVLTFRNELNVSLPQALGHLCLLGAWARRQLPDGDMLSVPEQVIADSAHWKGDPERFIRALVDAGIASEERDMPGIRLRGITTTRQNTPRSRAPNEEGDAFALFWARYRGISLRSPGSRAQALAVWVAQGLEDQRGAIMEGLDRWDAAKAKGWDARFAPDAVRFLRGAFWIEDNYPLRIPAALPPRVRDMDAEIDARLGD